MDGPFLADRVFAAIARNKPPWIQRTFIGIVAGQLAKNRKTHTFLYPRELLPTRRKIALCAPRLCIPR